MARIDYTLDVSSFNQLSWFIPMAGVTDSEFIAVCEKQTVASNETGDYSTAFGVGNQHLFILVNTIVAGGDLVITGTSVSEYDEQPTASDTETLTIDTTAGQYYQSAKKWLQVDSIDVASGTIDTIDYDIGKVSYLDLGNSDFKVEGYRADFRTTSNAADVTLVIEKVQDDGNGKMSFVEMERMVFDSTASAGEYIDGIRNGDLDFSNYFSNDENILGRFYKARRNYCQIRRGSQWLSSNIDHCSLVIYFN